MGNLPEVRSGQYSPFHNTGVDYAGPFFIKDRKLRGSKLIKGYVCLFVCFSTKAVHLELVTALTTEAFLAVLKRFISRRGKPLHIYSDNAKNFVGANRKLQELSAFFERESNTFIDSLSKDNISWHFIPPKSPNFGGLWEAGISRTKFHLKRVLGEANLTYEDFNTVLIQIEAVLNSRPLSPLSADPTDDNPLTPAHFLIGKSLTTFPEPSILNIHESKLTKYKRAQQLVEHFWKRWSKEYVSELQIRTRWKQHHSSLLKVGSLVLIKEENLPPLRWQLGRVIQLHPGADNITRVVSVKVSSGVIKRAVSKLCVLPTDDVNA